MLCISPLTIPRPNGSGNKDVITVPCGKCISCLQKKRNEWYVRLKIEYKNYSSAYFVTLTYMDPGLKYNAEGMPVIDKRDCQLFMKKLRKTQKEEIKYFLVGEYGTITNRPHYHAIIFNLQGNQDTVHINLLKSWIHGLVHIGHVTDASIKYCTKYIIHETALKSFRLMSKGLGKSYVTKNKKWHTADFRRNYFPLQDGKKTALPRYLKDKIYGKFDKEKYRKYIESLPKEEEPKDFTLRNQRIEAYKKLVQTRKSKKI